MNSRSFWVLAVGILIISAVLYWPNPKMGFVLDDHYVVAQNPVIKNSSLYPKILTGGLFDSSHRTPESKLNYYRPVLTASFAADYSLWGLNPFSERMVNIGLHALNCLLVFGMLVLMVRNTFLASLASLIFCVLPTHEWVVRYIVGRGDLLQALFSLVCFISVIGHCEQRPSSLDGSALSPQRLMTLMQHRRWQYVSWMAFVLAMLSREAAVLNVVFVFLITFYVTRSFKRTLQTLIPFVLLAGGYYLLRVQAFPIVGGESVVSGIAHGVLAAVNFVMHLWGPALVLGVLEHGALITAVMALVTVGLLVTIMARRDNVDDAPIIGFALLWIMAGILPLVVAQRIVDRLGPVLSEHFLYFSSIGFALLLAFVLDRMRVILARKILFVGLVTYFLAIGLVNGMFWTSEETLLRHVQRMEGRDFTVAFEQIAMRFDDDELTVHRLINNASSQTNRSLWLKRLGNIYHTRGDLPRAIAAFEEAIKLNPSNIDALNELGIAKIEAGDGQLGFEHLQQSLKMDPYAADTYRLIGTVLYAQGHFSQAIGVFQKALTLDPDQSESWLHLMMAYYLIDDQNSYLETLDRAAQRFGDERTILRFVANQLFAHNRFAETVKVLEPTKHLFATDPPTLELLAQAQRRSAGLLK